MKKKISQALSGLHLEDFVRGCFRKARWAFRFLKGVDRRLIKKYFRENHKRKLQIGSGHNPLEGWLNTNYYPKSDSVVHVDATKRFPFDDNSFDYVYSEHMIEHIPFSQARKMLSECFRILRPGGTVRIVTPDFRFLHDLYTPHKTPLQLAYIEESTKMFIKDAPFFADIFVINNFHRNWGHQFIFDTGTLKYILETVGFINVTQCTFNESSVKDLQNIANEGRYPQGFLKLESLSFEGTKP